MENNRLDVVVDGVIYESQTQGGISRLFNEILLRTGVSGISGVIVYIALIIYIFKVEEAIILKKRIFDKLGSLTLNIAGKSRIQ